MKKGICTALICLLLLGGMLAQAEDVTPYSLSRYRDKTAGGVVGHVAGLLSGFEFIWENDTPLVPLPEEWFVLMKGPYGGGSAHGGAGVSRMLEAGIGSDDDYHIDFFNQLILAESGAMPSHRQIFDLWRAYQVSDWGGGDKAMSIMRKQKLPPPYTGLLEYGNIFHWCTEPYIENETLGLVAPCLPQTAWHLADRLASVTGDFESLDFARFWAAAYAAAYGETDAQAALIAAREALLPGSWPAQIYDACFALYEAGTPWETAVVELEGMRREIYQANNIQCAADVNNGFAILALLYGENDFVQTVKLASISGYDADCTAATAGGLLGVLHGAENLPEEVLDAIWQDGEGVYVNDRGFTPHIGGDYPDTMTFGEIVDQYVRNGIAQVIAAGGRADEANLYIPLQGNAAWQGVQPENADFESGSLEGWQKDGEADFYVESSEKAHSGDHCAAIKLTKDASEATLHTTLEGLVKGEWYRLSAYMMTSFDGEAQLFVGQESDTAYVSALNANKGWVLRELIFQAEDATATAGITAAQQPMDGGITAYLDDMRIERLEHPMRTTITQEHATLVRREEYTLTFETTSEADMALCLPYSYAGTAVTYADVLVDGEFFFSIGFPPTSAVHAQTENAVKIPLRLPEGAHTLTLVPDQDGVMLYGAYQTYWPAAALDGIMQKTN